MLEEKSFAFPGDRTSVVQSVVSLNEVRFRKIIPVPPVKDEMRGLQYAWYISEKTQFRLEAWTEEAT
jgi:hypothetical protein